MHILNNYTLVKSNNNGFYTIKKDGMYILHVDVQSASSCTYHAERDARVVGFIEIYINKCLVYRVYPMLPTLDAVITRMQSWDIYSMLLQLFWLCKFPLTTISRQHIAVIRVPKHSYINGVPTFGKCYKLLDVFTYEPLNTSKSNTFRLFCMLIRSAVVEALHGRHVQQCLKFNPFVDVAPPDENAVINLVLNPAAISLLTRRTNDVVLYADADVIIWIFQNLNNTKKIREFLLAKMVACLQHRQAHRQVRPASSKDY